MSALIAWLASVREDVALLSDEYLPETLLILVALLAIWLVKAFVQRRRRPMSDQDAVRAVRVVSAVAGTSAVYDIALGVTLLAGRDWLVRWFGVPAPVPPIHADLNGLFTIAIGIGYWWPWREPDRYRWYLWLMGPGLKGIGALAFILDHFVRRSPAAFLLFSLTDGCLALLTLWALIRSRIKPARVTG